MFFLLVVLKIPVIGMIYLLWWATHDQNLADEVLDEGEDGHGRRKSRPRFPIGPRRDPHSGGAMRKPEPAHEGRFRQPEVVVARARELARSADKVRK